MGADLITYIVVGPDTITLSDNQRAEIVKQLQANAKQLRQDCLEDMGDAEPTSDDFANALAEDGGNPAVAEYCVDDTEIEFVLDDFLSVWHELRRDSNKRLMPGDDGRCIFVAGEMSWGDAPPGEAYQAIDIADGLGLLTLLGIE